MRSNSNPLVRRLRRHANLATLFRASFTGLEPRPLHQDLFLRAGPRSGLPVSQAFLPSTLPAWPGSEVGLPAPETGAPLAELSPTPMQPEAQNPPHPAGLPAAPVQAARAEAAPAPGSGGIQSEAEAREWQRLQAIVRKHQDKATGEASIQVAAPAAPGEASQHVTAPATVSSPAAPLQQQVLPAEPTLPAGTVLPASPEETPPPGLPASEASWPVSTASTEPLRPAASAPAANPPEPRPGPIQADAQSPALHQATIQRAAPGRVDTLLEAEDRPAAVEASDDSRPAPGDLPAAPATEKLPITPASSAARAPQPAGTVRASSTGAGLSTAVTPGNAAPGNSQALTAVRDDESAPAGNEFEAAQPAGSAGQPLPLQAAWPVQISPSAVPGIPLDQGWHDEQDGFPAETFAGEAPTVLSARANAPAPNPQAQHMIQAALQTVKTGQPSESSVELIPPRKPRPLPAGQAPWQDRGAVPASPLPAVAPGAPLQRQPDPGPAGEAVRDMEAIPTEIGPLPSDLWELIDEASPARPELPSALPFTPPTGQPAGWATETPPAAETPAAGMPASAAPAGVPPGLQKTQPAPPVSALPSQPTGTGAATLVQRQPEATPAPQVPAAAEEQPTSPPAEGPDVDELAHQVYREVRRRFAQEWERLRGRR